MFPPFAIAALILLLTATEAEAIQCSKSGGATWRLIDGKRCWYTGPRAAKERLSWAAPARAPRPTAAPKQVPRATAPALTPAPAGAAQAMLAFEAFQEPQINAQKLSRGEAPAAPAKAPEAKRTEAVMTGLMVFVSAIGAMLVFCLLLLGIGMWLEERARRRWDLRGLCTALTTPPTMGSANVVQLRDWR